MSQNVVILGSTGSIGENTLEVIDHLGPEFRVWGLSAHTSWQRLAEQSLRFDPRMIVIGQTDFIRPLSGALRDRPVKMEIGEPGLIQMASSDECHTLVSAVVGAAGLGATLAAVQKGKRV